MKRLLYITSVSVMLSLPLASEGQNINSTADVQRDFESGLMNDIVKSSLPMTFPDTIRSFGLDFDYSVFDIPYNDLYEFTPRAAANINLNGEPVYPWLFFRGEILYPWTPSADLFIQPGLGKNAFLSVFATHDSFFGPLPEGEDKNRTNTVAGTEFKYVWRKMEARGGVNFTDKYYQIDSKNSRHSDFVSAFAGVRSVNITPTAFCYDVNFRYDGLFNAASENTFDMDASFGASIKRFHRVALKTDAKILPGAYLVELTPGYQFVRDRWNASAGLIVSISDLHSAAVMPDFRVGYEIVKQQLWVSAAVRGSNQLNSVNSMLRFNPISRVDNAVSNTFSPVGATLGFDGSVKDRFTYSIKGFWSVVNNVLSFDGAQTASLSSQQTYGADVSLGLKLDFLTGSLNFKYCGYSDFAKVYMRPKILGDASFTFNVRHRWFITLGCDGRGAAHYLDGREMKDVSGFANLKMNVTYRISHRFSVYVRADNLINSKIYYIADYLEPGISGGAGVSFKF